jgi:hypothetical protein
MTCPRCATEMNHQADKLAHPVTEAEIVGLTVALDGVIVHVCACPGCGWVDSQRSSPQPRS